MPPAFPIHPRRRSEGDGGFVPAGDIALPGNGTPAKGWPKPLGTINVGDFTGGPHGHEAHPPSG